MVKFLSSIVKKDRLVFFNAKNLGSRSRPYSSFDIAGQVFDDTGHMDVISVELARHERPFKGRDEKSCKAFCIHAVRNSRSSKTLWSTAVKGLRPASHRATGPFG